MIKIQIFFCLSLTVVIVSSLLGGPKVLSGNELKEAEKMLDTTLSKLASGDGPSYKIGKVKKATRQLVAGIVYKFQVQLMDGKGAAKECVVKIWSRAWLKIGVQVSFECQGEETVTAVLDKIN